MNANWPLEALLNAPRLVTRLAFVSDAPPTELPVRVAAVIEPPDWPIVPAEVTDTVPVPAPMAWLILISPDVVVVSDTAPLLVAIPVTAPTVSTVSAFDVSLNAKAEPTLEIVPASVSTALAPARETVLAAVTTSPAAVIDPPVWAIVPAEVSATVPVPASIFWVSVRSPAVVVVSDTFPLLVVIPVTPPTVPTVSVADVLLSENPWLATVINAATVPIALVPVSAIAFAAVNARPVVTIDPLD